MGSWSKERGLMLVCLLGFSVPNTLPALLAMTPRGVSKDVYNFFLFSYLSNVSCIICEHCKAGLIISLLVYMTPFVFNYSSLFFQESFGVFFFFFWWGEVVSFSLYVV